MQYLMTQSLLNSYLYQFKCLDDYAEEAHKSFLNCLNRIQTPTTDAQQKGINFEKWVYHACDHEVDRTVKEIDCAAHIAEYVKGGTRQYIAHKDMEVSGLNLFLYGRLDVLKAGTIYDIKFTKSYSVGKFFDSPQHPFYLELIPEAKNFMYLVSNGSNVWAENYTREETPPIKPVIQDFIQYLKNMNLLDAYKEKWICRK